MPWQRRLPHTDVSFSRRPAATSAVRGAELNPAVASAAWLLGFRAFTYTKGRVSASSHARPSRYKSGTTKALGRSQA